MRKHLAVTLMAVAMVGVLSGCVFSPKPDPPPPPTPLPPNDTPQNTILRFLGAYEQKKTQEYQGIFTTDFTYEFSNSTDPDLVAQYSNGWFKPDEKESSSHLFQGYTPPGGETLPAAQSIDINLAVTQPVDDNAPGVDPVTHKVLFTRVDGQIVIPPDQTFLIENNQNVFYIVRGDQAAGLDTDQLADASHWYIYRWVDLSQPPSSPQSTGLRPASTASPRVSNVSWGSLKSAWR